jgi:uncharacterized membrane protein HdeD (DUF308 family)
MPRPEAAARLGAELAKERNVDEGLGARFWGKLIGVVLVGAIGVLIVFLLFTRALYRWGALGALIAFSAVMLLWGWIYDRRQKKKYDRLEPEI